MKARIPLKALASLTLLTTLAVAGPARAELYKWVDDDGNITYSQNPPLDRDATLVAPPPPPPDNPTTGAKLDIGGKDQEKGGKPEDGLATGQDLAKLNKQNCEAAKRNLEIFKNYSRYRNENNEIVDLDDKTRATRLKETERQMKEFCK